MPLSTVIASLLVLLAAPILGAIGITDPDIPRLARDVIPPSVALVMAVVAWAHHRTVAAFVTAAAQSAQVAQVAAADLPDHPKAQAIIAASAQEAIGMLADFQGSRAGVLAVGPSTSGRHGAPPPVDPLADTLILPAVPAVPVPVN